MARDGMPSASSPTRPRQSSFFSLTPRLLPVRATGRSWEVLAEEHEQRQASLDLLDVRSKNRRLLRKNRRAERQVAKLTRERLDCECCNNMLWAELGTARDSIERLEGEEQKWLASSTEQAALLAEERELRQAAEEKLRRYKADRSSSDEDSHLKPRSNSAARKDTSWSSNTSSNTCKITNNSNRSSSSSRSSRGSSSSDNKIVDPSLAVDTLDTNNGSNNNYCPLLPELVERINTSLNGIVSRWVKDMQAACDPELTEAPVLSLVLETLFSLCSELVSEKRQELVTLFSGGPVGEKETTKDSDVCEPQETTAIMPADTANFTHHRRHHQMRRDQQLTLFPLSGASLEVAVDKIIRALADSMTERKGAGDQSAKNPEAMCVALAASGLAEIAEEYLHIIVGCTQQQKPAVAFTDDIGRVVRFDSELHSESIDGKQAKEWCVVVFPALVVSADTGGSRDRDSEVVGRRFVLTRKRAAADPDRAE